MQAYHILHTLSTPKCPQEQLKLGHCAPYGTFASLREGDRPLHLHHKHVAPPAVRGIVHDPVPGWRALWMRMGALILVPLNTTRR